MGVVGRVWLGLNVLQGRGWESQMAGFLSRRIFMALLAHSQLSAGPGPAAQP